MGKENNLFFPTRNGSAAFWPLEKEYEENGIKIKRYKSGAAEGCSKQVNIRVHAITQIVGVRHA